MSSNATQPNKRPTSPRRIVLIAGLFVFAVWIAVHLKTLTATQNGLIRFVLSMLFGTLIVVRAKPKSAARPDPGLGAIMAAAIGGTVLAVIGLVMDVGQAEWLGLLLLLWACLRWSLPGAYARDAAIGLLLIYFAHPLPAQLFGPLQLGMQFLSVHGSDWLLRALNVDVWADGFVLRTGFSIYEVPAWCSGMRTATTVFLLSFALSVLNRMPARHSIAVLAAGLVQALLLNIVRITVMVLLVPRLESRTALDYLHDTSGVIVLLAVALVSIELFGLQRWRARRAEPGPAAAPNTRTEVHPPVWRSFLKLSLTIPLTIAAIAIVCVAIYRNRPGQKLTAMRTVAGAAQETENIEEAVHIAKAVELLEPEDWELKMAIVRLLLLVDQHEEVLERIDKIPDQGRIQANEKKVLRAYALMAVGRIDEAADIVARLPRKIRDNNVRVAMILAEIAVRDNDPDAAAHHVRVAARWMPNMERVRRLYPYLREHRKWETIAETDDRKRNTVPAIAFSTSEAYMNLDRSAEVGRVTLQSMVQWRADPRVLEPLFYMSVKRGDTAWEERFAQHLERCIGRMGDVDTLYDLFEKCFQLSRADLAWNLYRRMSQLDPAHPALAMSVVRYGHRWFEFRKRAIGLPTGDPTETIDLRAHYLLGRGFTPWRPRIAKVPLGEMLYVIDPTPARRAHLDIALEAFRTRLDAGGLSTRMRYLYAHALEISGDITACVEELEQIREDLPEEDDNVHIALSEVYERRGDWQNVYETLRHFRGRKYIPLAVLLRLYEAEKALRLGLAATHTGRQAYAMYPHSAKATSVLAAALIEDDGAESALALLARPRQRHLRELDILEAGALHETERFRAAETFAHSRMMPAPPIFAQTPQRFTLPPAELGSIWHRIATPTDRDFGENQLTLERNLKEATSPFLKEMMTLWLAAYASGGEGPEAEAERWAAAGRDALEKGIALHQLVVLLCHAEKFVEARAAARLAVEHFPHSGRLWRWAVGLTESDPAVLDAARRACPDDPELWLSELVRRRTAEPETIRAFLREAIARGEDGVPAAALSRAGEYLFRKQLREEACLVTRAAVARARSLLPTYILGIRCAISERNREWALECTGEAIRAALRPPPALYRKMVELKSVDVPIGTDQEMVAALRSLREADPENPLWAEMLGYVRFERGGWEIMDAYMQMSAAIERGSTNRNAYLIAGEASRRIGNAERSADVLRRGLRRHPGDLTIMNNLLYSLSYLDNPMSEALDYIPTLLAQAEKEPRYLDTVATVYASAGWADAALPVIEQLESRVPPQSHLWFRAQMNRSKLAAHGGELQTAIDVMHTGLREVREVSNEDTIEANRLIATWRDRLRREDAEARTAAPPATPVTPLSPMPATNSPAPPGN